MSLAGTAGWSETQPSSRRHDLNQGIEVFDRRDLFFGVSFSVVIALQAPGIDSGLMTSLPGDENLAASASMLDDVTHLVYFR
ncbi:hypothetical protein FA95DRAFT_1567008 [Auriscalpium vulgare]|uniref:Uncharacterized protein n=1 Tax=Auriscalpium vulgare TaxID=40419 RepID=A0ACB8R6A6_9AGAM|nr:hypothetical protein FA95DRAFT_1567008 [Auriscalpium vulgare]